MTALDQEKPTKHHSRVAFVGLFSKKFFLTAIVDFHASLQPGLIAMQLIKTFQAGGFEARLIGQL